MPLPDQGVAVADMLDNARAAAGQQAALGLTDMFIACRMTKDAPRVKRPGVGAAADQGRLDFIVDLVGQASAIMKSEGVRAALHPHIGTWIETESEARYILDAVDAGQLAFGPDARHLSWAGADLMRLISDRTYQETVVAGLWAEPGSGVLDLTGMLAALGPSFDGWLIAEVDYPTLLPFACAEVSARWLAGLRRPRASVAPSR